MIPKQNSTLGLSLLAQSLLLELKGRGVADRPKEGELHHVVTEHHSLLSIEETREALAQLMGKTPEHKEVLVERDSEGGYFIPRTDLESIRGHILLSLKKNQHYDGANYFPVVNDLLRKGFSRVLIISALRTLTTEGVLLDDVGRFTINPKISQAQYDAMLAVVPTAERGAGHV